MSQDPRCALSAPLDRFIATISVGKYRLFCLDATSNAARSSTVCFRAKSTIRSSGFSIPEFTNVWARSLGTQLRERESGFRYTASTCFETFPFPKPTDAQRAAIAEAARELDRLRTAWLNPPEWTREEILEFPGSVDGPWRRYVHDPDPRGIGTVRYPRLVPKDAATAKHLAKRTLTNLYNQRPTWLALAHDRLDEAVFAAYGWDADVTDDQLLEKLLALNLERAGK